MSKGVTDANHSAYLPLMDFIYSLVRYSIHASNLPVDPSSASKQQIWLMTPKFVVNASGDL